MRTIGSGPGFTNTKLEKASEGNAVTKPQCPNPQVVHLGKFGAFSTVLRLNKIS